MGRRFQIYQNTSVVGRSDNSVPTGASRSFWSSIHEVSFGDILEGICEAFGHIVDLAIPSHSMAQHLRLAKKFGVR
jgi:hypothetical protein